MKIIRVRDEEGPDGELTARIWPGVKAEILTMNSAVTMKRETFLFFLEECITAIEDIADDNGDAA